MKASLTCCETLALYDIFNTATFDTADFSYLRQ